MLYGRRQDRHVVDIELEQRQQHLAIALEMDHRSADDPAGKLGQRLFTMATQQQRHLFGRGHASAGEKAALERVVRTSSASAVLD